jgi:Uma2 family endonuclease
MTSGSEQATKVRQWTINDYHRMLDAGILTESDRVELLNGQIIEMSPQRPPHTTATKRAYDYLKPLLSGRADVRSQSPIILSSHSEPEPDIAVVAIDELEYSDRHPRPNEIFLLIEVADSTLVRDLGEKEKAYSEANIQDYWVVDVRGRQVHIFRHPVNGTYQQKQLLGSGSSCSLLAFPDVDVSIKELLPPTFSA